MKQSVKGINTNFVGDEPDVFNKLHRCLGYVWVSVINISVLKITYGTCVFDFIHDCDIFRLFLHINNMFYTSCYLHEIAVIIIVHLGQLLNTAHRVF